MKNRIVKKMLLGVYIISVTLTTSSCTQQLIVDQQPTKTATTSLLSLPQTQLQPKQQPSSLSTSSTQNQQLYTAELQVTGEDEEERKQIFAKALEQILIKNKDNQIVTLPLIKTALSNPGIYVQRYTYVTRNSIFGQQSLFLQIQFDKILTTQLLQQAQTVQIQMQHVGDKQQVLVWLAKVTPLGNKIVEDESSNDIIIPILKKNAQDFGISIILPAADLQDVNRIKANDICNLNIAVIKNASKRYKINTIIAGCIKQPVTNNIWNSQWLLLHDDRSNILNFNGKTAENIIMQAMHTIASNIAGAEEQPINQTQKLTLRITNVKGLEQYNEVVRYLTACNQITRVDLVKIGTSEVELSINISGDQQTLLATLAAQNKLIRNTDIKSLPPGIDLDYKWIMIDNEQTQATGTKLMP